MDAQSVLIADLDMAVWHELPRTLAGRLPVDRFDYCSSREDALDRIEDPAYTFVISGALFAAREDFVFLDRLNQLSVPLVVAARPSTVAASRRALERGALDLITLPIEPNEAFQTIRLATWISDILHQISAAQEKVKQYDQRLSFCPPDPELEALLFRCDVVLETSRDACRETALHIRQSVEHLAKAVIALQREARTHAFAQLRRLEAADSRDAKRIAGP
ncbi:MAG TPA: hypothetical protein VFS39_07580 [Nitrospira sp.]|nr:hypothetical protein [Nitrospira sp.]